MTPTKPSTLTTATTILPAASQPTRTYRIDPERGRVLGVVEGRSAMVQAVAKMLQTERFAHLIYSGRYGIELKALIGRGRQVLESELRRIVREALLADSRVTDVTGFAVTYPTRRSAHAVFTVHTIFGDVESEVSVPL